MRASLLLIGLLLSTRPTSAVEDKPALPDKPAPPKEQPKDQFPPKEVPKEQPKPKKPATGKEAIAEKAMDDHFASYDKSGDGKLTLAEFRSAYRGLDLGEGPRLFKERNGDKDEFLDREEFGGIPLEKILSKNEKDALEGKDWKKEMEKRRQQRERERDRN